MICVMRLRSCPNSTSAPQHYRTALYFPKPPLLTLDGPLKSLRFSFLAPTFLHMDATRERGLLAHPLFFSLLQVTEDPLTKMFLSQGARETDACILFLLAFAFNSRPSDERHFQMVELVW